MSVQRVAEASQKYTCPGVTGAPPEVTAAVSVTTVPDATELTGVLPEVTVSVVVVAVLVAALADCADPQSPSANARDDTIIPQRIRWRSADLWVKRLKNSGPGAVQGSMQYYPRS